MVDTTQVSFTDEDYLRLKEEFQEKEKAMQERLWLDSTVNSFDELLRSYYNKSAEEFALGIIEDIAFASQAFTAVLYRYDKDTELIEVSASYAKEIKKETEKKIKLGEGLVGQAIQSQKPIYLEDIPADRLQLPSTNFRIESIFVSILPLQFNENVFGALELVYLKPIPERYKQWIQRITRSLAAVAESIFNEQKLQYLLKESREQAETLLTQEEELRQNLEELHATQEAVLSKEKEIELMAKRLKANEEVLKKATESLKNKDREQKEKTSILEEKIKELEEKVKTLELDRNQNFQPTQS